MNALTIRGRNAPFVVLPPFYDEIGVASLVWVSEFDCARTLRFIAENGDPVTYELVDASGDPLMFRRRFD